MLFVNFNIVGKLTAECSHSRNFSSKWHSSFLEVYSLSLSVSLCHLCLSLFPISSSLSHTLPPSVPPIPLPLSHPFIYVHCGVIGILYVCAASHEDWLPSALFSHRPITKHSDHGGHIFNDCSTSGDGWELGKGSSPKTLHQVIQPVALHIMLHD